MRINKSEPVNLISQLIMVEQNVLCIIRLEARIL